MNFAGKLVYFYAPGLKGPPEESSNWVDTGWAIIDQWGGLLQMTSSSELEGYVQQPTECITII